MVELYSPPRDLLFYFPRSSMSVEEGSWDFIEIVRLLDGLSPYYRDMFQNWEDSADELVTPITNIPVLAEPERFVDTRMNPPLSIYDDPDNPRAPLKLVFASRRIENELACLLEYTWDDPVTGDLLEINAYAFTETLGMTQSLVVKTFEALTAWRKPNFANVVSHYMHRPPRLEGHHRAGYFCWIPESLTAKDIPSAYAVVPMNGGTFIQTTADWFDGSPISDIPQRQIMHNVELELYELGLLPLK